MTQPKRFVCLETIPKKMLGVLFIPSQRKFLIRHPINLGLGPVHGLSGTIDGLFCVSWNHYVSQWVLWSCSGEMGAPLFEDVIHTGVPESLVDEALTLKGVVDIEALKTQLKQP